MEPQVSFDPGVCLHPENVVIIDGDCGVITSIKDRVASKKPAKKPTRQWAAWTRQEEESFFTALRQVGKNFEKITCRVQSKNKDQVRHYYYRLVRRMNKLLGPELCLDAKNSKDTNAAMLRWWSLLEKYSCKASKLHLKPRRFKIFIETLEHQLLKDRKKNIRRRPSQGENCSTTPSLTVSNQGRTSGNDAHIKLVLVDSQNIQKLGSGKGSSLRRNPTTGVERSNCKGDSSPVKATRQRRRPGSAPTAAYKRWEKAAIAGVSLVADAAEHLERTAMDKLVDCVQDIHSKSPSLPSQSIQGEKGLDPVAKDMPTLSTFQQNLFAENNVQASMKLKLQLFPIDESTRGALERDNHNPHLELTLSTRKKISSVLEHLNRKWGSSSIASGDLTLLPYCVQRENLVRCQKWTQDSVLSAGDVYSMIGSPPVFRLRYGWFSNADCGSAPFQAPLASCSEENIHMNDMEVHDVDPIELFRLPEHNMVPTAVPTVPSSYDSEEPLDPSKDQLDSAEKITALVGSSDFTDKVVECLNIGTKRNIFESSDHASGMTWQRRETSNGAIRRKVAQMDKGLCKGTALSTFEWADSLTNISVGDLLSEMSHNMDANCIESPLPGSSQCLQQIPFSCDSFDAAIAAHINKHRNESAIQPVLASSIWDAEETRDAFSFQRNTGLCGKVDTSPQTCKQTTTTSLVASASSVEKLPEAEEPMDDHPAQGDPMSECQSDAHPEDGSARDLNGLTDIYWPDSLGPLDLDVPSCRYHSDDLILSDSLSGLNRIINSSLDTFQNCSFFGLDKREPASTVEARETASFADYKIDNEV